MKKTCLFCVLAALTVLLAAGSASAATYCVGASSQCTAGSEYPFTFDGLQAAVDHAESSALSPGADTISVAGGTIEFGSEFLEVSPPTGEPLTITGAGRGSTIFHSTTPDSKVVDAYGRNDSLSISDLSVKVDGPQTGQRTAIVMNEANLSNIGIDFTSANNYGGDGVSGGGECDDCVFALTGIYAEAGYAAGDLTIKRSRVYNADNPLDPQTGFREAGGGALSIVNSTITGMATGLSTDNGTINLTDSVLDMGNFDGAQGVYANNANNGTSTVAANIDGATIVGTGGEQTAVYADAATTNAAGETAQLAFRDTLIMSKGASSIDIACHEGTNGTTSMLLYYTFYNGAAQSFDPGCGYITAGDVVNAYSYVLSDIFVSPSAGDYRLKPAPNPAIDADNSTPDSPGNDFCGDRVDLLGNPRCVDSANYPAAGRMDYGAVEYQNYRPDEPSITAPDTGLVGDSLSFSASSSDANGDTLNYAWAFGDGGHSALASPTHTYASPGTYTVSVLANDGDLDSVVATATVSIAAKPIVGGPGPGSGGSTTPLPLPTLTLSKPSAKIKFKKRAKLTSGFKVATKKPKGAWLLATASAAVSGTITLYTSKGKPLKGSQKLTLKAGKSYLTFGGKWNKKKLPPGKYTLKFSSSSLADAPKSLLNVIR